jgi:hypothetical protein
MKKASAFIAALLALVTSGCALSGKPKPAVPATPVAAKPATPPTPPPPTPRLSIPQTQVELPRYQPVDEAALATDTAPTQPESAEPAPVPRPPANRRTTAPVTTAPAPAPAVPPAVAPAEPAPPQIQEIVPPVEAQRLQQLATQRRREVQQILDQLGRRALSVAQRNVVTTINSFLASSLDAERRGEVKLSDALAERAQILAKDLANGK